ncbi:MAG TPA: hypothetical protein VHK69_06885 [Chitinophagaceae bacterium]|nr:hypothetical protein [Chitinophagaceae bacterium]
MQDVKELNQQLLRLPLPFEGGREIDGVSLNLLDLDIAGYASRRPVPGSYSVQDREGIKEARSGLELVWPALNADEQRYFFIHRAILDALDKLIGPGQEHTEEQCS